MFRVCDYNTFYSPQGGGVRQYIDRKLAFYRRRTDVAYTLIIPGPTDSHTVEGLASCYTMKARPVPGAKQYRWTLNPGELGRILRQDRPDVIEVGAPYGAPWVARLAARDLGAKLIGYWHANFPRTYVRAPLSRFGRAPALLGQWAAWQYAKLAFGSYDALFAASDLIVGELERQGFDNVLRSPLGVDVDLHCPQRRSEGPDRGQILFLGRFSKEKGITTLLEAYPRIKRENSHARLNLVGDGPQRAAVDALSRDYPEVQNLGYLESREEVADILANATVVAVPGDFDTFSLTTIEALSSGTPVVTSGVGAASELVRRAGGGSTFSAGDPEDLAKALGRVLSWSDEEWRAVSGRARQYALNSHRWDDVLELQLEHYRRLAQQL